MSLVFSIPVYSGMPSEICAIPSGETQQSTQTVQTVSSNNYLKTLSVKGYAFSSPFKSGDDGHQTYSLKIGKTVGSIRIDASPVSKGVRSRQKEIKQKEKDKDICCEGKGSERRYQKI